MKIQLLNTAGVVALEVEAVEPTPAVLPEGQTTPDPVYPIAPAERDMKITLMVTGKEVIMTRKEVKNLVTLINNGIV